MSFDWRECLDLARKLHADENADEAAYRCAIGRAYYAAFHASRLHTRVETRGEDSHAKVWNALKASADPVERSAGLIGDRIKKSRADADYEARAKVDRRVAKAAIEDASTVIGKVEQVKRSRTLN